ncbi:enoyl-CoA hydratase-related protein [Gordonia humi]|uniref:Enoyl-CoA hydratase n=1 Tax=Gordonia humi TaxID=686429 RepID=A0A840F9Z8_9ACTN|nr:enoyl-CoA hydratase-related protein [Gordonia humi]MBB4136337.1 enoyl-CoA hydratase [Gordonia humi]
MSDELIQVEIDGHVTWLTLNRPDRLNALSDDLLEQLGDVLDATVNTDARVVVIRGAGRAFCAGYDVAPDSAEVGYAAERTPVEDRDRLLGNIELFTRIWRHPQPVIAAVHGHCVAGGAQLASMCDVTIVADDANIMTSPALPLGGGYLSPLWVHRVGGQRAKLMSMDAGRRITGAKAAEWGWAAEAVPADELHDFVRRTAHSIARTPGPLLRLKKEAVNRAVELEGLLTYARTGAETDALLHLTPEVRHVQSRIKEVGLKAAIVEFNADFDAEFGSVRGAR